MENVKTFNKYCSASVWTSFSTKFVNEAKVKNGAYWNIANLFAYLNSFALNIIFVTMKEAFEILNSEANVDSEGPRMS